jgi:hypothetical protein
MLRMAVPAAADSIPRAAGATFDALAFQTGCSAQAANAAVSR